MPEGSVPPLAAAVELIRSHIAASTELKAPKSEEWQRSITRTLALAIAAEGESPFEVRRGHWLLCTWQDANVNNAHRLTISASALSDAAALHQGASHVRTRRASY